MKIKKNFSFVIFLLILTNQTAITQWQQTAMTTGSISSIAATQSHIFAVNQTIYSSDTNRGRWTQTGINSHQVSANSSSVFSIAWSESIVYRSTNNGISWTQHPGGAADGIYSIAVDGNNIYTGLIHYGLKMSVNNGENWSFVTDLNGSVNNIAAKGNVVFAERQGLLYRSTNLGLNWVPTSLPVNSINAVLINGNIIYAGTENNGVYISTDNGTAWSQSSLNNQTINSMAITGNDIFAASNTGGIYYTGNSGLTWIQKNEGLTNLISTSLLIYGDNIFVGTGGAGVWKRPLSEVLVLQNISSEIPEEYSLLQNYPNPFNPETRIKFSLPKSGLTSLKVYDIKGSLLSTLVSEELEIGTYVYNFNAGGIASGVYFYILASGDFTSTNKMILVK